MTGNLRSRFMKLYATTTSERASKGQGGNKFLTIQVKDEKEAIILTLAFDNDPYGGMRLAKVFGELNTLRQLVSLANEGIEVELYAATKGKKQKTAKVRCNNCMWTTLDEDVAQCPNCKTDSFLMDL